MTPEEAVAARTRAVEENNADLWFRNDEIEEANAALREEVARRIAELEAQDQPEGAVE